LNDTPHEQEARPPNRTKSTRESGQRLGTNNIPTRSIRIVRMAVTKTRHITFEMKPYGWMRHMGVSKPTEMTIRDLLQEELRKRGVAVE